MKQRKAIYIYKKKKKDIKGLDSPACDFHCAKWREETEVNCGAKAKPKVQENVQTKLKIEARPQI